MNGSNSRFAAGLPQPPTPRPLPRAGVAAWTLATACGSGRAAYREALAARRGGLTPNDYPESGLDTVIGRVAAVEAHRLPARFGSLDSRNNRLADHALELDDFESEVAAALSRFGASRVGVIMGTSTASIGRTESAYAALGADGGFAARFMQPEVHQPHSVGHYVARRLGVAGPVMSISTACSSSGKVFAAGARWLAADLVDAVVVGGCDSLCLSILHGFASLELVSRTPCRPFDAARDGINIGEAAGFALLLGADEADVVLAGHGETSDAHHMAQPHPEGRGAAAAMHAALGGAGLEAADIAYVNLHGTATPTNDTIEALALSAVFDAPVLASSTKGWTGHTLGAAGIVGAITALETLGTGVVPGTLNLATPQADLGFSILAANAVLADRAGPRRVMSNSLGFGGSNCSLVFEVRS